MLLRSSDGTVSQLDGVTGLLVGVDASTHRTSLAVEVPAGTTLIAYTDGLIERPGQDLDQGIGSLMARLSAAPVEATPAELCRHAVGDAPDRRDDVAVIAVRFEEEGPAAPHPSQARGGTLQRAGQASMAPWRP